MKRDKSVTFDLDREARNERTKAILEAVCAGKVHVLTVGSYEPTLVMYENARDAYKGNEAMKEEGWEVSNASDDKHKRPVAPLAFWVRHPSPFTPAHSRLIKGRVFPPDSPCPHDVEYAQHQNGIVFRKINYGCGTYATISWRAMTAYEGDDSEHSWSSLNGDHGDASPMTEVFLLKDTHPSVNDLTNPIWRAVEAVVTPERLAGASRPSMVADLVYDAVVAAFDKVIVDRFLFDKE